MAAAALTLAATAYSMARGGIFTALRTPGLRDRASEIADMTAVVRKLMMIISVR